MWRNLTSDEAEILSKKLKNEGKIFNLMFFLFAIVTIFISLLLMEMYIIIIPLGILFFLFKLNPILYLLACLLISIPFHLAESAMCVAVLAIFMLFFQSKAKLYDKKQKAMFDNEVKICETQISSIRVISRSRYGITYGITVNLYINEKIQNVELRTSNIFEESENVYVVSYAKNSNFMEIFKLSALYSDDLN